MRYFKHGIFLFVFSAAVYCLYSQEIKKIKTGELKTVIDSATHPLIINFWASWCQPCIHEIPYFEKNVNLKKDSGVELILVSMDLPEDYPANIAAFAKQHGFASQIIFLDEINADVFAPALQLKWDGAVPASLFVNNQKNYRQFYEGQLTEPKLKTALDELIDGH